MMKEELKSKWANLCLKPNSELKVSNKDIKVSSYLMRVKIHLTVLAPHLLFKFLNCAMIFETSFGEDFIMK